MSSLPVSTRLCCPGSFGPFVQPPKQETLRILSPMTALLTGLCHKVKMAPLPWRRWVHPAAPPATRAAALREGGEGEGGRAWTARCKPAHQVLGPPHQAHPGSQSIFLHEHKSMRLSREIPNFISP